MEADLARCPDAQESDSEETAAALATAEQAQQQHLASVRTGDRLAATQLEVFFARRPGAQDSDSDGEETAAALAAAQRARQQRRADERTGDRLVARLAALAASASASGRWMEAIELCTRALAERPNDTELLAQRASACARAGHYAAALHDGELMVRLTPDWYRGFQVCGSALFCLRRFASAAQAYGAAVRLAAPGTTAGLQDALADCHRRLDVALRRAILEEDHEGFDAILFSGQAQLDLCDETHGLVPLALAAAAGRARAVAALLEAGANPESVDRHGKTPLIWAAAFGHMAVAAELLRTGDADACGESGGGSDGCVGEGRRGADGGGCDGCAAHAPVRPAACLGATDAHGWNAFFHACHGGHVVLVEAWVAHVDLAATDQGGATALHAAVHAGHAPVVRLLVQSGASLTAADARQRTPRDLAEAQLRVATDSPQRHAQDQRGGRPQPTQSARRGQHNPGSAVGSGAVGADTSAESARRWAVVEALRSAAGAVNPRPQPTDDIVAVAAAGPAAADTKGGDGA